jgi:NAD-dependent deacetylase
VIGPDEPLPPALLEAVKSARRLVVVTGAGVSAESGVPTFRGAGGLWREFRAEELATPQAYARDPLLVWEWYNWRRQVVAGCQPNAAHEALVRMEQQPEEFLLLTQNVDGLHARAGSRRLIEIHGSLFRLRCTARPRHRADYPPGQSEPHPACPHCGAPARPDIVWFGERLDAGHLETAFSALEGCDALLVVGTSGVVEPVASMPLVASRAGAYVAALNLEPSPLESVADAFVLGAASVRMTELMASLGW